MSRVIQCTAEAESALGPGYARITLTGVDPFTGRTLKVRIERGGELDPVLGPDGWQSGSHWIDPDVVEILKGETSILLGAPVTRHLRVGTTVSLTFQGDSGWPESTSAVSWPAIVGATAAPEGGRKRTVKLGRGQAAPPDPQTPPEPDPMPVSEPEVEAEVLPPPQSESESTSKHGLLMGALAAGLLLVLIGGGTLAYLNDWFGGTPETATEETKPDETVAAEPVETAWPPDQVRAYLGDAPVAADSLTQARLQMEAGALDMAFLLFKNAAGQGDAAALAALGMMYDPDLHSAETSPLPDPNPVIAVQYYRQAADAGNAVAQRRLGILMIEGRHGAEPDMEAGRALLTAAADAGDAEAKSYLESNP